MAARSAVGATSDLDAFSICGSDYSYPPIQPPTFPATGDDFGFDPLPNRYDFNAFHPKTEMDTPPEEEDEDDALNAFSFDPVKPERARALKLETTNSIVRNGQVTPPRSNSESSMGKPTEHKSPRQRRPARSTIKEEPQTTPQSHSQPQPQPQPQPQAVPTVRKRRNTRKNSTATNSSPEEDEKRKQSLEKNRLAAAKCRVNKKEKTEQLQRDSHDKACQNAFLSEQVMRMKEEIQQMNALLLQHANHEGCKSSEDIHTHLNNNISHDFYPSHMGLPHDFTAFDDMSEMEQDDYFSPASNSSLMNPPLPEFARDAEFDVETPMHDTPMHDD